MSEKRIYKRDELVGKQVIGTDAKIMGSVKDFAYDSDGNVGFMVQPKTGEEAFVLTSQIVAFGDVILVKSRSQCPKCSHVNKDGAKFCAKCGSGL